MSEIRLLKEKDVSDTELISDGGRGVERMVAELDGVDPDAGKPREVAVALAELLRRLARPKNAHTSALRFVGLLHHLAPDIISQSLTASAKQLGITRAGLSKAGLAILEEFRIPSRYHKSSTARESYRKAQIRAVSLGRHASQRRRKKQPPPVPAVDKIGKGYAPKTRSPQHHLPRPPAKTSRIPCNPS